MAESQDIFIGYNSSLENLAQELTTLLNVKFKYVPDNEDHRFDYYTLLTKSLDVKLMTALDFENDRDMNFGNYQYYVSARALRVAATLQDDQRLVEERNRFACFAFDALKATGRFPLMLVHDMQTKIEEFSPAFRPVLSKAS